MSFDPPRQRFPWRASSEPSAYDGNADNGSANNGNANNGYADAGYRPEDAYAGDDVTHGGAYRAGGNYVNGAGYSGTGYDGRGYDATGYDGNGYAGGGYAGSGYAGGGYPNGGAGYPDGGTGYRGGTSSPPWDTSAYPGQPTGYADAFDGATGTGYGDYNGYAGGAQQASGPQQALGDPAAWQGEPGGPAPWPGEPGDPGEPGAATGTQRVPRGRIAGALTGLAAASVAIGVASLAAAFVRAQASPIIAVGDAFIDRTPPALKNFAVERFGENDKTVLLLSMYVTMALIALTIGALARRFATIGVVGVAAFGLFGAFVALTRPDSRITDIVPSIIGGIAGVAAFLWLSDAATPRPVPPGRRRGRRSAAVAAAVAVDRRKFLATTGTAVVAAAAAEVGGQALANKRFTVNTSAVKLAAPVATPKPLPKNAILNVPGLTSFYTPNSEFYRVDTTLATPQVQPSSWQLRIHGMVDRPMTINYDDLIRLPQIEHDITITCVAEGVGGGYIGNARWQGTLLAGLLRKAGIQSGATQIVMRDVNGMNIGVATDPVMDGRSALLAVGMNGVPLPQEHGFPARVVVPGLYGYVSACKWVVDMEVTTLGAFDAYWVQRGWSKQAPIKTESRIDVPRSNATVAAGKVTVAGVAWAQHKGIEAVEVFADGKWQRARLAAQDTIDTWRQWYYVWDATPGKHTLKVRATDKTGYTQTSVVQRTEPNGATGFHTIQVSVT